jgi:hypothetical protein
MKPSHVSLKSKSSSYAQEPPAFAPFPGGGRGQGGPSGPGMGQQERKLVKQFDLDKDGKLTTAERQAARQALQTQQAQGGFGGGGFRGGGRGGFGRGGDATPPKPGKPVTPAEVKSVPGVALYAPNVLRTLFLTFESKDWETELSDFRDTDVEVPAELLVDGKRYPGVGVHFRGASSYFMVPAGYKRSLNISVDFTDSKLRLEGYKTLNLLNSNGDPTFLRTALYAHIARQFLPAPKVNLVRVVINGESWGIYANQQQFDKEFLKENYPSSKGEGIRWKVPGSPRGGGGLRYQGEDSAAYTRLYEIKTDDPKRAAEGWKALIALCRTLEQTPPEKLEATLAPLLDIDEALKFLAVENVLINEDGYWTRASDFNIYQDAKGKFHVLPHDMNEAFKPAGGPGGRGGFGGGGGLSLDPLVAVSDPSKPLLSRLLAVPSLRTRYLGYMRTVVQEALDWSKLQPIVASYQTLIRSEVTADTRKLDSLEAFVQGLGLEAASGAPAPAPVGGPGGRRSPSLREFVEQRRSYLLGGPLK